MLLTFFCIIGLRSHILKVGGLIMKKALLTAIVFLMPAFSFAGEAPKTEDQKTLYFLGATISRNLKQFDLTKDETKYIIMGFSETIKGEKSRVDDSYGVKINEFFMKKREESAKKEKAKAAEFIKNYLNKNKKAKKFDSGLVYLRTKKGKGKSPKETDTVKVHYHGTTIDGKVFDSSVDRKQPAEFPLRAVISCWTEGLQKMKVGEKGTLLCPSDIAYGDAGRPPTIAPGATLMFDVELLDIVKKK